MSTPIVPHYQNPINDTRPAVIADLLPMRFIAECQARRCKIRRSGPNRWRVSCLLTNNHTHGDQRPSAVVTWDAATGTLMIYCHACRAKYRSNKEYVAHVVAAIGWRLSDLSVNSASRYIVRQRIKTAYPFEFDANCDRLGAPAFKVRLEPFKSFRWARARRGDEYVFGLMGRKLGLFRYNRIIGQRRIALTESPHDVEHLWEHCGIAGTCPPHGAAQWLPAFADAIQRAGVQQVDALPHNDDPGRALIDVAAASLHARGIVCRIVELPGLPRGGDVVDFLAAGRTPVALRALIDVAPAWTPEWADQQRRAIAAARVERQRALATARARKYRRGPTYSEWKDRRRGVAVASTRSSA